MGSAGREKHVSPPADRLSLPPDNRSYGHLQDVLSGQTLARSFSQLSLSSPHDLCPSGAGGYANGSGSGSPVARNVVDRRPALLFEQLGLYNVGSSDTRLVDSSLSRDHLWNFPLGSGSGSGQPPSNLNRNGYVPSYCPNRDSILCQGWNFPLPSVSGHPSNSNRNGFASSSSWNQDGYSSGHGGCCLACGSRFTGHSSRSRISTRAHVSNSNTDHNNRRVFWSPEPLSLEDIRGRIEFLAKDQQGCRSLQSLLDNGSREIIDMIFSELVVNVTELMVDPFANHVVQKLVDVCSEDQRSQLVTRLVSGGFKVVNICLNQYGGMTVQKLLERTESYEPISALIMAISRGTVPLIKDQYGHRVIQHCLKNFSEEDTKCILNAVIEKCFEVATDKSGCCVLQQCVECSSGDQRDSLVLQIIAHARLLAEDRYGNYVVQHILGLKDQRISMRLVKQLQGNFVSLSCNKYGSNVVEKCLLESGDILSTIIIVELVENPKFSALLTDNYGNYVVQSALSVAKGPYYAALANLINMRSQVMRNNLYGKRILAWFERKNQQHVQR